MEKKYELVEVDADTLKLEYKERDLYIYERGDASSNKLYRIRSLRDFGDVKKGDLGGYIEKEENLSHEGNCWVYDRAVVYMDAKVRGDSSVSGLSVVSDKAKVYGKAQVGENARVYGDAKVYGSSRVMNASIVGIAAKVFGKAVIGGNASISGDAKVYGNAVIFGDVNVRCNAVVYGEAHVGENAVISGYAKVYGYAYIHGYTTIAGKAKVYGKANISGESLIGLDAEICGYTGIAGTAQIYGKITPSKDPIMITGGDFPMNTLIKSPEDFLILASMGRARSTLTVFVDNDGNLSCTRGCFNGTLDQFRAAVKKRHGDNKYGREYLTTISYIKNVFRQRGRYPNTAKKTK